MKLKTILKAINKFLFNPQPVYSVALLRIGMGILLIGNWLMIYYDLDVLSGPRGMVSLSILVFEWAMIVMMISMVGSRDMQHWIRKIKDTCLHTYFNFRSPSFSRFKKTKSLKVKTSTYPKNVENSANVDFSLLEEFKKQSMQLSTILKSQGIHTRPFLPGLPYFEKLTVEKQHDVSRSIKFYADICAEQIEHDCDLKDNMASTYSTSSGPVPKSTECPHAAPKPCDR